MTGLHLVVLAAGKGTRMKSERPKVLHAAAGLPLIEHVLRTADRVSPESVVIVVGHQAESVRAALGYRQGLTYAVQEPQLGTGHALLQAEAPLSGARGTVVLLSGDVPLLKTETLRRLLARHDETGAAATVLTAIVDDPHGYGRIERANGQIAAIVEHKDASGEQRRLREINSGIYAFDLGPLFDALRQIGSANAQGEYYLPDLVRIYRQRGLHVETVTLDDPREIMGVNSRKELAQVAGILKMARNGELMDAGVTIVDPATAYIGADVTIGADTIIHPNVFLEGQTRIGSGCEIQSNVRIVNSTIEDGALIDNFTVVVDSTIGRNARVGPFARIRPASVVGEEAHIGNFVELKKTTIGRGSKASHLTYLGDATIGEQVNIGAGTITCNYDGVAKHQTTIEDGAFIGSDSQLIAPVTVGRGAYVGAGSSITQNVPPGSLAIARGKQVNKEGWVEKTRGMKRK
ncbi:MAG: bifunctional UDP-N-acetylglucosamine diphosphorylase/glucosamine-1-phosphate N-acetyltransferase GlmU [Vicinamibacterales bacterium]